MVPTTAKNAATGRLSMAMPKISRASGDQRWEGNAQCNLGLIDCQQNTGHLAFLGGREIPRAEFLLQVEKARNQPAIPWTFDPVYWNELLPTTTPKA